jgi:uncharacterized protein YbcI
VTADRNERSRDAEVRTDAERARGQMLSEISNEMVRIQKRYWGRGAVEAKSYLMDDLLLIVMRGGLTVAEESMLAHGHAREVRAFRQVWQDDMTEILTTMVEERTGRNVVNYQSQVLFDPDVVIEIFMFGDADSGEPSATATPTAGTLDAVAGAASEAVLQEPAPEPPPRAAGPTEPPR